MCERSARQQKFGCLLTDLLVLWIHGERVVLICVSHARALLAEFFLLAINVPAVALPGHVPIAASDAILQVIKLCQCPALLDTCSGVRCMRRAGRRSPDPVAPLVTGGWGGCSTGLYDISASSSRPSPVDDPEWEFESEETGVRTSDKNQNDVLQ